MLAILAPVPAGILGDGLNVKNREGMVAFGTGSLTGENSGGWSFEFFSKPEIAQARGQLPVLIYGSKTDLTKPHHLFQPGYITAIAIYQGIQGATPAGKHPRPDFRPKAALDGDTAYPLFWHVSELKALARQDQIPLKELKLFGSGVGKLRPYSGGFPLGPLLVVVPDKFTSPLASLTTLSRTAGEGGAHAEGVGR